MFRLTPPRDKAAICARLGLTGLVVIRFDASLAAMSAEDFIANILVARLRAAAVVVGWDFHFGKGRSGSPATLAEAGLRHGFGVEIVPKVENGARATCPRAPFARRSSAETSPQRRKLSDATIRFQAR